jgi:hypothetical protein
MAKTKGKRRRRGTGSVIAVRRKFQGVGRLDNPRSMMGAAVPPLTGGLAAGLTAVGIRYFAKPTSPGFVLKMAEYAPWVGLAAGGLASLGMFFVGGATAATSSFLSSGAVAGAMALHDWAAVAKAREMAAAAGGTSGVGVVVPEYGGMRGLPARRGGTGAIIMEPSASRGYGMKGVGSYGEVVNLGAINPGAFGTPGFQI